VAEKGIEREKKGELAPTFESGGANFENSAPLFVSQTYIAWPFWSHKRNYSIKSYKEMKNENVHMQALHCKLGVVLVQILPNNRSETNYSFCEDSPPAGLRHLHGCRFHPQTL